MPIYHRTDISGTTQCRIVPNLFVEIRLRRDQIIPDQVIPILFAPLCANVRLAPFPICLPHRLSPTLIQDQILAHQVLYTFVFSIFLNKSRKLALWHDRCIVGVLSTAVKWACTTNKSARCQFSSIDLNVCYNEDTKFHSFDSRSVCF